MSYSPIDAKTLHPGMPMHKGISTLGQNINEVYKYAKCVQAFTGAVVMHDTAEDGSDATAKYFVRTRGNSDNVDITFKILAGGSGGTSTPDGEVTVTCVSESGLSSSQDVTGAAAWKTYTFPIPSHDDPMDWELKIGGAQGGLVRCYGMICYYDPDYPDTGTLDSGFQSWDSSLVNSSNDPISTEMVDRIRNAPIQIAKDRPTTLYSFFSDHWESYDPNDESFLAAAAAYDDVYQIVIDDSFQGDAYDRTYRIDLHATYQPGQTNDILVRARVGSSDLMTFEGIGWLTGTFTTSGKIIPIKVECSLGVAREGPSLDTVLIRREPTA